MNESDRARSLLTVAGRDLKALKGMGDPETFADEIFGFHAQQAIEKALKAWITVLGEDYPLIHNLARLLAILEEKGCNIEAFWDLVEYTAFAVAFRYESEDLTSEPLNRPEAVERVQGLLAHVIGVVEGSET